MMPERSNPPDFDRDIRYRRPAAWRRVKELSPVSDALCRQIEDLCRAGEAPINCPRECLYVALHHFALNMTQAQRMAAWMAMNRWHDRARIAPGALRDDLRQSEPEYWETHTIAAAVAEALVNSVTPARPDELRIIEKADYQPGEEPGSRCYWSLDVDQGILWLYWGTPLSVREEIIAEARQRFAQQQREA
jgi:hypothetical protein